MFPNWLRWKGWSLPSKASYAGLWIGVAGFVVGVVGIILAVYFYNNPKATPPSATDEFVRRTNPVQVDIFGAKLQYWLGDAEKALTLNIRNRSAVPVDSVQADIELRGSTLRPFKSEAFREIDMSKISVPAGRALELPFVSVSTLEEAIGGEVCGVGLNPLDLDKKAPDSCQRFPKTISTMLTGVLRYKTVFKETKIFRQNLWVYSCDGC